MIQTFFNLEIIAASWPIVLAGLRNTVLLSLLVVPLGLCGGWRSLDRMNSALRDHGFDFVAASRPFVAEPDFFRRLRAGQTRAACTSCNECAAGREPILHCPPARDGRLATPAPPKRR